MGGSGVWSPCNLHFLQSRQVQRQGNDENGNGDDDDDDDDDDEDDDVDNDVHTRKYRDKVNINHY